MFGERQCSWWDRRGPIVITDIKLSVEPHWILYPMISPPLSFGLCRKKRSTDNLTSPEPWVTPVPFVTTQKPIWHRAKIDMRPLNGRWRPWQHCWLAKMRIESNNWALRLPCAHTPKLNRSLDVTRVITGTRSRLIVIVWGEWDYSRSQSVSTATHGSICIARTDVWPAGLNETGASLNSKPSWIMG